MATKKSKSEKPKKAKSLVKRVVEKITKTKKAVAPVVAPAPVAPAPVAPVAPVSKIQKVLDYESISKNISKEKMLEFGFAETELPGRRTPMTLIQPTILGESGKYLYFFNGGFVIVA